MFNKRFLYISLTVQAIADAPDDNTVAGTVSSLPSNSVTGVQYLVQGASSGDLENYNNYIIRYNGSDWELTRPHSAMLELINSQTGEFLHYDGSNWNVIASTAFFTVDCIVDFDYSSSNDNAKINNIAGISFISSQSYGNYTRDNLYMSAGKNTDTISKSILGSSMTVAMNSDGKIYTYNAYEWNNGITPASAAIIILKATGAIYIYDGSKWSPIGSESIIFADNIIRLNYKNTSYDNSLINVKGTKFICFSDVGSYTASKLYTSSGSGTATSQDISANTVFGIMEDGILVFI